MDYDTAIAIFNELDDNDQTKEIYAYFGLAIYYAQVMEQHAINMIVIKKMFGPKVKTVAQVDSLWDKYDFGKKTFGVLANEIKTTFDLSAEHEVKLNNFKNLRNYIAHNYFRFNSDLFFNEKGKRRMVKDFIDFKSKAQELDTILTGYFSNYKNQLGFTDEKIEEAMEKMMKEAKNKIINDDYDTFK